MSTTLPRAPMVIRNTVGLIGIYIGLGLVTWRTVARIVRANTMSLKEKEYVETARGLGAPGRQIVRTHLLPNTVAPIVVAATLGIPGTILSLTVLAFNFIGDGLWDALDPWLKR